MFPFSDESFDMVISMGSIKHWSDVSIVLREFIRVLKTYGWLVVANSHRDYDLGLLNENLKSFGFSFFFHKIDWSSYEEKRIRSILDSR